MNTTAVKLTDKERGDSVIEGEMFSDVGTLGHFNCIWKSARTWSHTYTTEPRILARWKRPEVCRKPSLCPSCTAASSPNCTPFR